MWHKSSVVVILLGFSVRCIVWCWWTVMMWWEGLSLCLTSCKPWSSLLQVLMHCTPNSTTSIHPSLFPSVYRLPVHLPVRLQILAIFRLPVNHASSSTVNVHGKWTQATLTQTFMKWWQLMGISMLNHSRLTRRRNMGSVSCPRTLWRTTRTKDRTTELPVRGQILLQSNFCPPKHNEVACTSCKTVTDIPDRLWCFQPSIFFFSHHYLPLKYVLSFVDNHPFQKSSTTPNHLTGNLMLLQRPYFSTKTQIWSSKRNVPRVCADRPKNPFRNWANISWQLPLLNNHHSIFKSARLSTIWDRPLHSKHRSATLFMLPQCHLANTPQVGGPSQAAGAVCLSL